MTAYTLKNKMNPCSGLIGYLENSRFHFVYLLQCDQDWTKTSTMHSELTMKLSERAEGLFCSKICPDFSIGANQTKVSF